jgi:hypothetical protein
VCYVVLALSFHCYELMRAAASLCTTVCNCYYMELMCCICFWSDAAYWAASCVMQVTGRSAVCDANEYRS